MQKILLSTALLIISSPVAFASKARLQALGEQVNGSQYISDNRNIFLNPAHVNLNADLVTYEWGSSNQVTDDNADPRGEGGILKSSGNFVWGIHFGNESDYHNFVRKEALGDALSEQNNVDFFFGGDAGMQWGFNVTYGKYVNEQTDEAAKEHDDESNILRTRLGVISGDLEGYANIGLANTADAGKAEYTGKTDLLLGGNYNFKDVILFTQVDSKLSENKDGDEFKTSRFNIGVGQVHNLNEKAKLFARVQYESMSMKNFQKNETKQNGIPVSIGLEVATVSWLTLRGSVGQYIFGVQDIEGDKKSISQTTVNAGASLIFGEMTLDGVIGNDSNGAGAPGQSTEAGKGTLRSDALMSRVSMNYKF